MKLSTWIVSFCLCPVSTVFPRDSFTSFSCSLQIPYSNFSSTLNLLFLCHFGWGASFRPQFILSVSLPPFPFLALAGTGTGSSCPRLSRQGKARGEDPDVLLLWNKQRISEMLQCSCPIIHEGALLAPCHAPNQLFSVGHYFFTHSINAISHW